MKYAIGYVTFFILFCSFPARWMSLRNLNDLINAKVANENRAKQEAEDRIAANKIPLSEKIANASKLGTLCGNVNTWLKYDNKFSDEDFEAFKSKLKEIYSAMKANEQKDFKNFAKWKQVSEIVGEETASQWINEIIGQNN